MNAQPVQRTPKQAQRRRTLEHEAAHCAVTLVAGGTINSVNLGASLTATGFSFASVSQTLPVGNGNAMVVLQVAGPAQQGIAIARDGASSTELDLTIQGEAAEVAAFLQSRGFTTATKAAVENDIIRKHLVAVQTWLSDSLIQTAVQNLADLMESAEASGQPIIQGNQIGSMTQWSALPPLPTLPP